MYRFGPLNRCPYHMHHDHDRPSITSRVESRPAFAGWLCRQHNLVNAKLGKPLFDCDMVSGYSRWVL